MLTLWFCFSSKYIVSPYFLHLLSARTTDCCAVLCECVLECKRSLRLLFMVPYVRGTRKRRSLYVLYRYVQVRVPGTVVRDRRVPVPGYCWYCCWSTVIVPRYGTIAHLYVLSLNDFFFLKSPCCSITTVRSILIRIACIDRTTTRRRLSSSLPSQ